MDLTKLFDELFLKLKVPVPSAECAEETPCILVAVHGGDIEIRGEIKSLRINGRLVRFVNKQ